MHTRASNSELVEPLPEPERTLNRRLHRRNRSVPFEQRNEPPAQSKVVYVLILDFNWYRIFTKGQKQGQNRQNRARGRKEHEKVKVKVNKSQSQHREVKVKDKAEAEDVFILNGPPRTQVNGPGKTHSGGSSRFKSRGGTGKLKCFICHSEGYLKRDCPKKKSSGFVKKGKHDQDSDSFDDEGNAYFGEALVVVRNDEMAELLGDNRTCTIKGTRKVKIQLHNGSSFILEDVTYVPGLRRSLISLGTLEKEGYTVKMQMGRIKVIKGCRVMMTGIRKNNRVYTLEAKVMTFGVQKHGGSKQVGFKQLGHKQVGFKQLGPSVEIGVHRVQDAKRVWFEVELQGAQGDREAEVFQVSNDDAAVAQRRLEDKQPEENTNTDCLVKEQEKVHLGIKVGENITVTGVPGQEGAKGNVAEKKKVKKSMKANLGKLLKYKAWLTRWSPVRDSSKRKSF
ncbi:zinc finger, CCHC-type containing protein [Tanacetum coccineum]